MPNIIDRDMCFKLDTCEIINEADIESDIEKEVKQYFKIEEDKYKLSLEDKLTKNLKNNFITNKLREYVENSYLIKIKTGRDIEENSEDNYSSLNRIIKDIKKDRPNDYSDVIDKIVEIIKEQSLVKYSDEVIEEEPEIEDELIEAIKTEEKKPDKLTKYINETIKSLYSTCFKVLKEEYLNYYKEFLESHKEEIDTKTKSYIKQLKDKEKESYISNRHRNIVNLFNYVLENYSDRINWIEDNKYVIMITKLSINKNSLDIVSGSICPDKVFINLLDCIKMKRYDKSFTMIMKENSL